MLVSHLYTCDISRTKLDMSTRVYQYQGRAARVWGFCTHKVESFAVFSGWELKETHKTELSVPLYTKIKKILSFDGIIYSAQIFQISATVENGTVQLYSVGLVRLIKIIGM